MLALYGFVCSCIGVLADLFVLHMFAHAHAHVLISSMCDRIFLHAHAGVYILHVYIIFFMHTHNTQRERERYEIDR